MSSHIADQSTNEAPEKGKGKASTCVEDPEDETTEDESACDEPDQEEEDEDDLNEIDTGNIIQTGGRTRGKKIDFVAANEDAMDEDSEDDEDFVVAEDGKTDA